MREATSFTGASMEEEIGIGDAKAQRRMAVMEGCLGGAAEPELQTKEADFKRVAEVD